MVGNAVHVLASSTVLSNNGARNDASFEDLKKNNFYYFQYVYYYYFYQLNQSMADSFYAAQKAYIQEILKHNDMLNDSNYQFNLNNAFQYQYFGLLEKSHFAVIPTNIPNTSILAGSENSSYIKNYDQNSTKKYITNVSYKEDGANIILYIDYSVDVNFKSMLSYVFNPPDGDKFKIEKPLTEKNGEFTATIDKKTLFSLSVFNINLMIDGDSNFYLINPNGIKKKQ